jgi:RNA polymerase sigma-70 factor (ECF subfamily)
MGGPPAKKDSSNLGDETVSPSKVGAIRLEEAAHGDSLADFHRGERAALDRCYREHFKTVSHAVGSVLRGADQETVIQEVFMRLVAEEALRRNFAGGSMPAWLATVARNQALNYRQRRDRERPLEPADEPADSIDGNVSCFAEAAEARLVVERFRREVLPTKWAGVFQARFMEQLDQREAAQKLGISRTTLAYQEHRVRSLLRRYLRRGEA